MTYIPLKAIFLVFSLKKYLLNIVICLQAPVLVTQEVREKVTLRMFVEQSGTDEISQKMCEP